MKLSGVPEIVGSRTPISFSFTLSRSNLRVWYARATKLLNVGDGDCDVDNDVYDDDNDDVDDNEDYTMTSSDAD